MADMIDVKKKVREVLLNDSTVSGVVGSRVYVGWLERSYTLPCITITDVSEVGEPSSLGDDCDKFTCILQVDVWCKGVLQRDELAEAVKAALGKKTNLQSMQSAGFILSPPMIRALDELDMKPPVYRKSLQFRVHYWTDYSEGGG